MLEKSKYDLPLSEYCEKEEIIISIDDMKKIQLYLNEIHKTHRDEIMGWIARYNVIKLKQLF